jgi:hypothetical protein
MLYQYNTRREKLKLPEYGRNIQKLVDHAITIENREERTKFANKIISIMSQNNTGYKDPQHYKRKLWDHLALLSDFKLDVDWPFEKPTLEILNEPPKMIPYSHNKIKFKHFGKIIELLILEATELEEGEKRDALIVLIGNHMKRQFISWNREENISDSVIFTHMKELSGGKLEFDQSKHRLIDARDLLPKRKTEKKPRKNIKNTSSK